MKSRFTKICLGLILCGMPMKPRAASLAAHADFDLRSIMRSGSIQVLELRLKSSSQREHQLCAMQLKMNRAPVACFAIVAQEVEEQGHWKWLEQACAERVARSNDLDELERVLRSPHVPKKCLNQAAERVADLEYSSQRADPAGLFQRLIRDSE